MDEAVRRAELAAAKARRDTLLARVQVARELLELGRQLGRTKHLPGLNNRVVQAQERASAACLEVVRLQYAPVWHYDI